MVRPKQTDLRYARATLPWPSTTHATQNAHNVARTSAVRPHARALDRIRPMLGAGWRNDVSIRNSILRIERPQVR